MDPCKYCGDYPHHCAGICPSKAKYINEANEDTPIIRKHKFGKQKGSSTFYKDGKAYVYNKNGIRREVPVR